MARLRSIDHDSILDAAERVIVDNGAANFTLDAVALAAGISKGSVVRDCPTKHDLIRAIVRRAFCRYRSMLDDAEAGQPEPNPKSRIAAHLQAMAAPMSPEHSAAAVQLVLSLANDPQLTEVTSGFYRHEIEAVSGPGVAAGPLLAFLAIEGIRALEMFGHHEWSGASREHLLNSISKLANSAFVDDE